VQGGHLQNAGTGTKVCYVEQGQQECFYVSLITAPYRASVRNYAIEARVRFPATIGNPLLAGLVLRAHGTSINPAPYLVADLGDFYTDCDGRSGRVLEPRRSVGHSVP
jgi:hypothetical protein